ncbi:hypothetical protein [Candidatus Scalindua japonica]|uniref:hypothetical protein n=1 Tax=Candidatus Scalindua japonica TaxID=1284222 RepID=UPI000BDEBAC1|nr:hypothetical protein [Candidatus Scalindua japonica]
MEKFKKQQSDQLFFNLRRKHPKFIYHRYSVEIVKDSLVFEFNFEIEPGIAFSPRLVINGIKRERIKNIGEKCLNNIAFHLGLMEIPSYWKTSCSPEIIIRAGSLDEYQISWWRSLLINGLGEFFFINEIDFTIHDFVAIKTTGNSIPETVKYKGALDIGKILVPIGGGKDSALTIELLKNSNISICPLSLNPTQAALDIIENSKHKNPIIVNRTIDNRLLVLNADGYLNGHTPFSAYLAFLSASCAILFDGKHIALSNERSSNEGNVNYRGAEVNHQYSKSYHFENRFREYSNVYLGENIDYFSLLRPFYELQISNNFSRFSHYFPIFRSCNQGQKTNSWCNNCPKCLSVFTFLYPFVEEKILTINIFSENLFNKEELISTAFSLLGHENTKPFECVGSLDETAVAFYLCWKKSEKDKQHCSGSIKISRRKSTCKQTGFRRKSRCSFKCVERAS